MSYHYLFTAFFLISNAFSTNGPPLLQLSSILICSGVSSSLTLHPRPTHSSYTLFITISLFIHSHINIIIVMRSVCVEAIMCVCVCACRFFHTLDSSILFVNCIFRYTHSHYYRIIYTFIIQVMKGLALLSKA